MATNEEDRVTGTVAIVLDERELLIELGENSGVELGMRFAILGQKEAPLPNGRSVTLTYPKSIVKIVRIEDDEYAVGRTFRVIKGRPGLTAAMISPNLSTISGTPDRTETIISGEEKFFKKLSKDDRRISVGDMAQQTIGDEYLDEDADF